MSRHGRHGRHPYGQLPGNPGRPTVTASERPATVGPTTPAVPATPLDGRLSVAARSITAPAATPQLVPPVPPVGIESAEPGHSAAHAAAPVPASLPAIADRTPAGPETLPDGPWRGADDRPTCTVAQLRRFIKSRPWVPMHELRRRFGIAGVDDDVSPIRLASATLFVGLPPAEARMMAELLSAGDVGFELSLDPIVPVVVGVYPMRPIPRG